MIEPGDHKTTPNPASDEADSTRARASQSVAPAASPVAAPPLPEPLRLQPVLDADDARTYHVDELLRYHDRAFIESVYAAVCGRRPTDAEGARELADLRGGRLNKIEIITHLLATRGERDTPARINGLPSTSWGGRVSRVPALGYLVRLVRGLARLPVLMQHQQQFETYALAQQQRIADYLNEVLPRLTQTPAASPATGLTPVDEVAELVDDATATVTMLAVALVDHSNHYARFQAQTQAQVGQIQAALAELTDALTTQQQLNEAMRRAQQKTDQLLRHEHRAAVEAQQEFLIQEQRVIVETQQAVLDELRAELRELSARQQRAHEELSAEVGRLRSLLAQQAARPTVAGEA